jgi:membrane-associated phospholipid phosphatase
MPSQMPVEIESQQSLPVAIPSTTKPLGPVRRALARLGLDYTLFFFFLSIYVALGFIYGAAFKIWEGSIFLAVGAAAFLIGGRFLYRARAIVADEPGARAAFAQSAKEILRDWGALILVTVIFENLHNFTGLIRKIPIDDRLYQLDVKLFGVEPSVWAGQFATPLLTDWFSFTYGLYFILPMILAVAIAMRGRREDFRELASGVVLHLCIGYLLFISFPAGPPRFYKPLLAGGFQPPHLTSYFGLWEWSQNVWDAANANIDHSSFPSMHCCIATLTLAYAWRFGDAVFPSVKRLFFWICLPLVVSLWASTVYLRHHWILDCFAGIALGIFTVIITPRLRRAWPRLENA